jgi:hypothetical protein
LTGAIRLLLFSIYSTNGLPHQNTLMLQQKCLFGAPEGTATTEAVYRHAGGAMIYCMRAGKEQECWASKCKRWCEYRATETTQYESDRNLVLACHIDWCKQRCSEPCHNPNGVICDTEIERLLARGLTIEEVLNIDLSNIYKVVVLAMYKTNKMHCH